MTAEKDIARRIAEKVLYAYQGPGCHPVPSVVVIDAVKRELAPLLRAVDAVLAPPEDKPFGGPRAMVEIEASRIDALRAARGGA